MTSAARGAACAFRVKTAPSEIAGHLLNPPAASAVDQSLLRVGGVGHQLPQPPYLARPFGPPGDLAGDVAELPRMAQTESLSTLSAPGSHADQLFPTKSVGWPVFVSARTRDIVGL